MKLTQLSYPTTSHKRFLIVRREYIRQGFRQGPGTRKEVHISLSPARECVRKVNEPDTHGSRCSIVRNALVDDKHTARVEAEVLLCGEPRFQAPQLRNGPIWASIYILWPQSCLCKQCNYQCEVTAQNWTFSLTGYCTGSKPWKSGVTPVVTLSAKWAICCAAQGCGPR